MSENVTISKQEYDSLLSSQKKLRELGQADSNTATSLSKAERIRTLLKRIGENYARRLCRPPTQQPNQLSEHVLAMYKEMHTPR